MVRSRNARKKVAAVRKKEEAQHGQHDTIRYCKILIFDLYDTVLKSVGYRIVKGTKWSALTSKTD